MIISARIEAQLKQSLSAVGWSLMPNQIAGLDAASAGRWRTHTGPQRQFEERNPAAV